MARGEKKKKCLSWGFFQKKIKKARPEKKNFSPPIVICSGGSKKFIFLEGKTLGGSPKKFFGQQGVLGGEKKIEKAFFSWAPRFLYYGVF